MGATYLAHDFQTKNSRCDWFNRNSIAGLADTPASPCLRACDWIKSSRELAWRTCRLIPNSSGSPIRRCFKGSMSSAFTTKPADADGIPKAELPSRALVTVKASLADTKDWHWMVFHRGVFYDPLASRPLNCVRRAPCFLIKLH